MATLTMNQAKSHVPREGMYTENGHYASKKLEHDAPPPYAPEADIEIDSIVETQSIARGGLGSHASKTSFVPCVIPQTTKSFRGAFFSPFIRAYAPDLAAHGVGAEEFLTFLDGVNEAFVANPVLQGVGIVGAVMTQFYGVHPVQWAGAGLQLASGLSSAAISYGRTRAYIKAMNRDFFNPLGLKATVLTTKKLMHEVGSEDAKMHLPPLDTVESLDEAALAAHNGDIGQGIPMVQPDDPRMRRIKALEGYVMPLSFDVPEAVAPDSMLRKMGDSQAKRLARRGEKKMRKRQDKVSKELAKDSKDHEKITRKGDKEIAKVEREIAKEQASFEKKLMKKPEETGKITREHEKEMRKLVKEGDKKISERDKEIKKHAKGEEELAKYRKREDRDANKIRWVVISKLEEGAEDSSSTEDVPDDNEL